MTDPSARVRFAEVPTAVPLALEGVRVLDMARLLPGPGAASMLGDFGADVIKLEQPGRPDGSRAASPRYADESVYFSSVNRNKRSLVLDVTSGAGREVLQRLIPTVDVIIETFRPGVAARLGVGYETLSKLNPRLIYCSVTGFGQSGPYHNSAGHDLNIAGLSGMLMPLDDRVPAPAGVQMADFAAVMTTVIAVVLALRVRDQSDCGQHLDVAMFDSLLPWTAITGASAFAARAGYAPDPRMEVFGGNPRYSVYRCRDGRFVSVSLLERSFWKKFSDAIDRPDLYDPNETEADRLGDHGRRGIWYRDQLSQLFASRDRDEWVHFLASRDVPCWPVYSPSEVLDDLQVRARGMLQWINDPVQGRIPQWAAPVRGERLRSRLSPAPRWGQHTDTILAELGFDGSAIARLRQAGVE